MTWIENRRVVITGATSGIGKEVAGGLASLGAHVVLACRDALRAGGVAAGINATVGAKRAVVMSVDTADRGSVRAFGRDYRDRYGSTAWSSSADTGRAAPAAVPLTPPVARGSSARTAGGRERRVVSPIRPEGNRHPAPRTNRRPRSTSISTRQAAVLSAWHWPDAATLVVPRGGKRATACYRRGRGVGEPARDAQQVR